MTGRITLGSNDSSKMSRIFWPALLSSENKPPVLTLVGS